MSLIYNDLISFSPDIYGSAISYHACTIYVYMILSVSNGYCREIIGIYISILENMHLYTVVISTFLYTVRIGVRIEGIALKLIRSFRLTTGKSCVTESDT